MGKFFAIVFALLALGLPASALAQSTTVPPGNSEADQYFETVPDGKGDRSPDNTREPKDVLTPKQVNELESLGPAGAAVAQNAAATAPEGSLRRSAAGGDGGGDGARGSGSRGSGDAGADPDTEEVGEGLEGSDQANTASVAPTKEGLGGWLWVIVIGTAVGAAGLALWRRRTGSA